MSYYGCFYCGSEHCDGSCDKAHEVRYLHEQERARQYPEPPDPWEMFQELSYTFVKDQITEEKFISDATCLGVVNNFDIIQVIQDKKEMKQKDSTNA